MDPEKDFSRRLIAARAGSETAWTAIYRELAPSVLGYLCAQRAPEPEDLLGEVFLQVVRDLSRFSGDERDFRAWVLTIAHHRLLDARRSLGRRPVEAAPGERLEGLGLTCDGEEEALRRLDAARLGDALGALSEDQRQVVLLRIIGGLTAPEVGRVTGRTTGAVKALQRRGLMALRRQLSTEDVSV